MSSSLPPLPPPDSAVVHVHTRLVGSMGAISRLDIARRMDRDEVLPDDLFWYSGMPEWRELRHHPELIEGLLDEGPPPVGLSDVLVTLPGAGPEPWTGPTGRTMAPDAARSSMVDDSIDLLLDDDLPKNHLDMGILVESAEPSGTWVPDETPSGWVADAPNADALVPSDTEVGFVDEPEPVVAHTEAPPSEGAQRRDEVFCGLLRETWAMRDDFAFSAKIDDVFVGTVVAALLNDSYELTDLSSDGVHHFLRFRNPADVRVFVRITHLTGQEGPLASVVVGVALRVRSFGDVWRVLQDERSDDIFADDRAGVIRFDGDMATQRVVAQVKLLWHLDEYVRPDWSSDPQRLLEHLDACIDALQRTVRTRFG